MPNKQDWAILNLGDTVDVLDNLEDHFIRAVTALEEILQECSHSQECEWRYYKLGARQKLGKEYPEWAENCDTVDCAVGIARRALKMEVDNDRNP